MLFLHKNLFFILFAAHPNPFFVRKLDPKIEIFRVFTKFFFRTTRLQFKLLILIESPNIFHRKATSKTVYKTAYFQKFYFSKSQCHKIGINRASVFILSNQLKIIMLFREFVIYIGLSGPKCGSRLDQKW